MTDPHIVRQDTPHEVVVGDGSQVAASRSLDPHGPQIRKTLASQDSEVETVPAPEIAPRIERSVQDGQTFERQASIPEERRLLMPEAPDPAPRADESIVFERSLQDGPSMQVDAGTHEQVSALAAVVIEHALNDHREALPQSLAAEPAGQGPVFERTRHDHLEAVSEAGPVGDRMLQIPPEGGSAPERHLAAPEGQAGANVQPVPPPPARPALNLPPSPVLPPVPTAQAQAQVLEVAKEIQAQVEETLGAADPTWVEMDFPARVIRLKIENDKVRSKLERLEAMISKD